MAFNTELSKNWSLEKYAKNDGDHWTTFESTEYSLSLLITPTLHLVVTSNGAIEECLNLWSAHNKLKGVFIKDSLMIIYKGNTKSHKIRIKFSDISICQSASSACLDCVGRLRVYFNIKSHDDISTVIENDSNSIEDNSDVIRSLISTERTNLLPAALELDTTDVQYIDTFLSMCLVDPEFPTFVDKVETILKKMIE